MTMTNGNGNDDDGNTGMTLEEISVPMKRRGSIEYATPTISNSMTVPSGDDIQEDSADTRSIDDDGIGSIIEIGGADEGNDASSRTSAWGEGEQSSNGMSTDTGHTPTSLNGTSGGGGAPEDLPLSIARKENRAVSLWRIFMFCVLITTTYAVAALVYAFTSNFEAKGFESAFADDTLKIYESLASSLDTKLAAVDLLAMLMVSSAREKQETFPFTTLTDFAVKAAKVCDLSLNLFF